MEEALFFFGEYQSWIYLVLGIAALIYLRGTYRGLKELRRAVFGLERESAMKHVTRSSVMLSLVCAGLAATFVLATFITPSVAPFPETTPLPTITLLTPAPSGEESIAEGPVSATLSEEMALQGEGCANPQATLISPRADESLSGTVTVAGKAHIDNFAFFKLEYASLDTPGVWRAISAGVQPVVEGELGVWDTSLLLPGEYLFRLVVTDTAGNAPLPCVVRVRILPSP